MIDFLEDRNHSGRKGQTGFLVAYWMESHSQEVRLWKYILYTWKAGATGAVFVWTLRDSL